MKLKQLIPMMESDDMQATLDFYTQTLGFEVYDLAKNERGIYWCSLYRDGAEIMFTDRNAHSKEKRATFNGVLYFYPDNVDELWQELKDKVTVEWTPQDFGYGMYDFAIRDNNGFILAFGQIVKD
ncbi:MAG: hypothetical protein HEP71_21750 [Roseivirga sp.]|nr:hypothetical protein [Roseivirga sp.]